MLNVAEQLLVSEVAKIRKQRMQEQQRRSYNNAENEAEENTPTQGNDFDNGIEASIEEKQNNNILYNKEKAIIQFILRNGGKTLQVPENKQSGTPAYTESIISYLFYSFKDDCIELTHPLYKRVFEEASQHGNEASFKPEDYFMAHPDAEVSRLAAELCSDRYMLSKFFSESMQSEEHNEQAILFEQTMRIATAYKQSIIDELLKKTMEQLKDPAIAADSTRYMEVMQDYKYLKDTQQTLNNQLRMYGFGSTALNV